MTSKDVHLAWLDHNISRKLKLGGSVLQGGVLQSVCEHLNKYCQQNHYSTHPDFYCPQILKNGVVVLQIDSKSIAESTSEIFISTLDRIEQFIDDEILLTKLEHVIVK